MSLADCLCARCAVFLDFDGTLVEIAAHPESVQVPPGLIDTLRALQAQLRGAVAVVSGRPITQIDRFLDPLVLSVAGVHGAERRRADGQVTRLPVAPMDRVEAAAVDLARAHPALRLEIKRGALALHYRQAPALGRLCLQVLGQSLARQPGLMLMPGKMVVEVKPVAVSKGAAIEAYLAEPPFAGRKPVFIGDDDSDEPGFAAVQALGGVGIKIGPGPTGAALRVDSPRAMRGEIDHALARMAA